MTDDIRDHMDTGAAEMRRVAQYGEYNGRLDTKERRRYFERCRRFDDETGTLLIYTRDCGHHTSGWWKNPDYENCLHLSLSFFEGTDRRDRDKQLSALWCRSFFGDMERFIWAESPFTDSGKENDVWHYRVFTSPDYKIPILPRGEVYDRQFTERGWLSFSDLKYSREQWPLGGHD